MPITKVIIENFKGIRDRVEIPIRPLTLLFGGNSAGKTTVLHALLYLRELLERQNADADRVVGGGKDIYLGGFRQIVHGHDDKQIVTVGVEFTVDDDGCTPYPLQDQATLLSALGKVINAGDASNTNLQSKYDRNVAAHSARKRTDTLGNLLTNGIPGVRKVCVEVRVAIPTDDNRPAISEYKVSINGNPFAKIVRESGLLTVLDELDARHPLFSDFDSEPDGDGELPRNEFSEALEQAKLCGHTLKSRTDRPQVLVVSGNVIPSIGEALDFELDDPDDEIDQRALARLIISQLVVRPGQLIRDYLRNYRHLGPIRSVPDLSSIAQRSPSQDRWIDGMAAWDLLSADAERDDKQLINGVNTYLSEIDRLNLGYSLSAETIREMPVNSALGNVLERFLSSQLTDLRRDIPVNPSDIGAGVSQVIPVLVSVLDTASKVTAIEQPELHLHPAVQCAIGDLFVRATNKADERFFLLETHSEHLLLRLMRRMRETQDSASPAPDLTLTPETITILFVETYEGRSIYREMPLNERGELVKAWPGGFFEEDMNELL